MVHDGAAPSLSKRTRLVHWRVHLEVPLSSLPRIGIALSQPTEMHGVGVAGDLIRSQAQPAAGSLDLFLTCVEVALADDQT